MNQNFHVKPHHKVRIPKGTEYRSTHPQKSGPQVSKRTYVVMAGTHSPSNIDLFTWVGSGKYWCWTKKENVELFEEEAP